MQATGSSNAGPSAAIDELSAYELQRARNIRENRAHLESLGIEKLGKAKAPPGPPRKSVSGTHPHAKAVNKRDRGSLNEFSLWGQKKGKAARPAASTSASHATSVSHTTVGAEVCFVCGSGDDEEGNEILLCETTGCARHYHQRCLTPVLEQVPRAQWFCPGCVASNGRSPASMLVAGKHKARVEPSVRDAMFAAAAPPPPGSAPAAATAARAPPLSHSPAAAGPRPSPAPAAAAPAAQLCAERWTEQRVAREVVLRRARAQLHLASVPERLLCREAQRQSVLDFCRARMEEDRGGALYVCGSPGLGKSLSVRSALEQLRSAHAAGGARFAFFNASLCFEPAAVYAALLHELGAEVEPEARKPGRKPEAEPARPKARALLEALLVPAEAPKRARYGERRDAGAEMCVVALDEIDQLLGRQQEVLYQLFDWAAAPASRLVLVGIANALDLTERFLPKLNARGASPQLLSFPPYCADELGRILTQRTAEARPPSDAGGCAGQRPEPLQRAEVQGCDGTCGFPCAECEWEECEIVAERGAARCDVRIVSDGEMCRGVDRRRVRPIAGHPPAPAAPAAAAVVIEPAALTFCAKKVAAASGDARRALEVCRVAVDKALAELAMQPRDGPPPEWADKPAVRFCHMSVALSRAFKSPVLTMLAALPQHQQLLLCSMALRVRRVVAAAALEAANVAAANAAAAVAATAAANAASGAPSSMVAIDHSANEVILPAKPAFAAASASAGRQRCTLRELYAEYAATCKKQNVRKLSEQEVLPLCHNLGACGVFGIEKRKSSREDELEQQVWLLTPEDDLKAATSELRFFRQLLGA